MENSLTPFCLDCGDYNETPGEWRDEGLGEKWERVREVRRVVTGALEVDRREGRIGASLEAAPTIYIANAELLKAYEGLDAAEIFITSGAQFLESAAPANAFVLEGGSRDIAVDPKSAEGQKCRRCWRILSEVGANEAHRDLCVRCADAVDAFDASAS